MVEKDIGKRLENNRMKVAGTRIKKKRERRIRRKRIEK